MQAHAHSDFFPLLPMGCPVPLPPFPCPFTPDCSFTTSDAAAMGQHLAVGHPVDYLDYRHTPTVEACSAGGKKRRRVAKDDAHPCPLGCPAVFYSTDAVIHHVQAIHIMREGSCPDEVWLRSMNRRLCRGCNRLIARRTPQCNACNRAFTEDNARHARLPGTPLASPAPSMTPNIAEAGKRAGQGVAGQATPHDHKGG